MNIYEKLIAIQNELKAPKSKYNSFGKYKYRYCEDILEAAKPLCAKYKAVLMLSDKAVNIGERYYIEATAELFDTEGDGDVCTTALAREDAEKKGMDGSQITGTASSYARKYALNGLFCIDDTKDADTDEYKNVQQNTDEYKNVQQNTGESKNVQQNTGESKKDDLAPLKEIAKKFNENVKKGLTCEMCGEMLKQKIVKGVTYSAEDISERSQNAYGGHIYCYECCKKVKNESSAN